MKSKGSKIILTGRSKTRQLRSIVFQSPLAGVSDKTFRKLVRKWAPESLIFTEMISATSLKPGDNQQKLSEISEETGPIGVQLFDYRPHAMAEAARKAEEEGAFLIDINMGCPVKKIARKGGGSGLIKDPSLAQSIVKSVAKAVQIPVSVKTRIGWSKDRCDPIGFALGIEDAGAQMITIHGRTRQQSFSGKADWMAIAKVKERLSIPLIANGDITNTNEAFNCLKVTGADGVMIGRGSLGAPWLVGQIDLALKGKPVFETPSPHLRLSIALEQLKELLKYRGEHGLLIARKHVGWTCKNIPNSQNLCHEFMKIKNPTDAIILLERAISELQDQE